MMFLFMAWFGLSLLDLLIGLSKGDRIDAGSYRMLQQRQEQFLRDYPHCNGVQAIGERLAHEGPQWVTGEAYEDLWQRVHQLEDEHTNDAGPNELLAWIGNAELRITGSAMGNDRELLAKLKEAKEILEKDDGSKDLLKLKKAREDVRVVWKAIHSYQDERWSAIRRASTALMLACIATALTGYGLLWLAIYLGSSTKDLQNASVLMLTGALVALVSRLYSQSKTSRVVGDYGLSLARLIVAPLLGALAAIMGIVLVNQYQEKTGLTFEVNLANLVIAAVFGLTPKAVLDQLKDRTEQIKAEIQSTGSAESHVST